MSRLVINGVQIFSAVDQAATPAPAASTTPTFATHRLVDGQWVAKGSAPTTPAPVARPIGFTVATPPVNPHPDMHIDGQAVYTSRKSILRAIEIAAGNVLLAGKNTAAIEAIRRGRLGGRKDNLDSLHALLKEYSA